MDANTIGSLVNLGSAGAVIIVVIIFLKNIKERDAEWRSFFTELNRIQCNDSAKRMELTEKILEMVESVLHEIRDHDSKTESRINAAMQSTTEAVNKAITKRGPAK